jgi:nucleotide-binding universal stress UspA family protein
MKREAEGELAVLAERLQREVPALRDRVSIRVEVGHPVRNLVELVETAEVDLLVLGSHGRTGVERLLLGSVAEQLIRQARCPVFTLKSFGKDLVAPDAQPADTQPADTRPADTRPADTPTQSTAV